MGPSRAHSGVRDSVTAVRQLHARQMNSHGPLSYLTKRCVGSVGGRQGGRGFACCGVDRSPALSTASRGCRLPDHDRRDGSGRRTGAVCRLGSRYKGVTRHSRTNVSGPDLWEVFGFYGASRLLAPSIRMPCPGPSGADPLRLSPAPPLCSGSRRTSGARASKCIWVDMAWKFR